MEKISALKDEIIKTLDINKALDIVSIDLEGKSSVADFMIIASGTSSRHIQALSEQVFEKLKINGVNNCCLLYTSPSPRDVSLSRMPSSA